MLLRGIGSRSEIKLGFCNNRGSCFVASVFRLSPAGSCYANCFKVTQPSPFVEVVDYVFPNFKAQPKEAAGEHGTLTSVFGRNWFS